MNRKPVATTKFFLQFTTKIEIPQCKIL